MPDDGDSLRFVTEGDEFRQGFFDLVEEARREILIETFILEHDDFGRAALEALERACQRGVNVRILVDGLGSHEIIRSNLDTLERHPAGFRIYHPLPWPFSRFQRSNLGQVTNFFRLLLLANKRDHRKVFVFDGETAILGSRNIWDESLQWKEASLFLTGPAVKEVRDSFTRVWLRSANLHKRRNLAQRLRPRRFMPSRHVLTNGSKRRKRWHRAFFYNTLNGAGERIWVTTPYLNPQMPFIRLLKRKASQGLDIRVLLPSRSDVPISKWLSQTIYHDLLNANVRIYEYSGKVLHAKALLTDERVVIGSSNFNYRSLRQDLEIDYSTADPALMEGVSKWMEENFRHSLEVTSIEQVDFLWLKKVLRLLLVPLKTSF